LNRKIKRNIIASIHPNMEIRCYEVACINELGASRTSSVSGQWRDKVKKVNGKLYILEKRKF